MSSARTRLLALGLGASLVFVGLALHFTPGARQPRIDPPAPGGAAPEIAVAPPPRAAALESPLPVGAFRRFGRGGFEHPARVEDLMFAGGGSWLVGCGGSAGARIWDARTGRTVRRFGGGDGVEYRRVILTPDNKILSVVTVFTPPSDTPVPKPWIVSVRRYDVLSGEEIARFPLTEMGAAWTIHAAFSPDGTAVFAGDNSGALARYDLVTGRQVWRYRPHDRYELKAVAVASDGHAVAVSSGAADGEVRLLDVATGRPIADLHGIEGGPGAVGFAGDGRSLATTTAAPNKGVTIWDRSPLALRRVLKVHSDPSAVPVLSPDGRMIAVWGWMDPLPPDQMKNEAERLGARLAWRTPIPRKFHLFDAVTGTLRTTIPHSLSPLGLNERVPVAFSPDGSTVATGGHWVSLWDTKTGTCAPSAPGRWGTGPRFALDFSPNGQELLHTQQEGSDLVTRDEFTGREVRRAGIDSSLPPTTHNLLFTPVRSADGRLIVSRQPFGSDKPVISVRDTNTDREVAQVQTKSGSELAVAFSWDGKQLATSDGDTVRVYGISAREPVLDLGPGPLYYHQFKGLRNWSRETRIGCHASPDGRYLAVIDYKDHRSPQVVSILSTSTWRSIWGLEINQNEWFNWNTGDRFTVSTQQHSTSYSASGNQIYRAVQWDVRAGGMSSRTVQLPDRTRRVVSPNGRMIATWGETGEEDGYPIRVFEVESGRERHRFVCDDPCQSAFFSPDGRFLIGHHPGASYLIWDVRGTRTGSPEPAALQNLDRACADLASDDAPTAFRAVRFLADVPDRAVPFLRAKLAPVAPPDPATVGRLVTALGAENYREREDAEKELERLGKPVLAPLRVAANGPAPEVRRRALDLIHRIGNKVPTAPHLVPVRAVEAVEWMGTAEARALLASWAEGAEGTRLTFEAQAAHARIK